MDSDEIYPYGWAPRGKRCEAKKHGNRSARERMNLVAGLKQGNLLAPVIFNGYCDGNFFLAWLEEILMIELETGDTVIMDNAPFHPKEKIRTLLENNGYKLLLLPRYSPRDNKIEHKWAPIKTKTRKILATIADINAALTTTIISLNQC